MHDCVDVTRESFTSRGSKEKRSLGDGISAKSSGRNFSRSMQSELVSNYRSWSSSSFSGKYPTVRNMNSSDADSFSSLKGSFRLKSIDSSGSSTNMNSDEHSECSSVDSSFRVIGTDSSGSFKRQTPKVNSTSMFSKRSAFGYNKMKISSGSSEESGSITPKQQKLSAGHSTAAKRNSSMTSILKSDNGTTIFLPPLNNPILVRENGSSKLLPRDKSFISCSDSLIHSISSSTDSSPLSSTQSHLTRSKREDDLDLQLLLPNGKKLSKISRRRSFNNDVYRVCKIEANSNATSPPPSDDEIATDLATESELTGPSISDSWESVSEQPNCEICGMIFKTTSLLHKHERWSLLHSNNLRKNELSVDEIEEIAQPIIVQEEGVQYKLMYSGSKFYWQRKLTVEIDLYHHILLNTIEVVVFNYNTNEEMKRLYLSSDTISLVLQDAVSENAEVIRKRIVNVDRFAKVDIVPILEEERRRIFATYVLSKLKVSTSNMEEEITFDVPSLPHAVFSYAPQTLVPVSVLRGRYAIEDARKTYEETT